MSRTWSLVAALVAAVALAASAGATAAVEPNGGSGFTTSADAWGDAGATCQPNGGAVGELCSATNSHDPGVGNPSGSIRSRLSADTGLLLFDSQYTWQSPAFTVPGDPEAPVSGAEFAYDRSFGADGLINLGPKAAIDATLIDETAGGQAELIEETLDADDDAFEQRTVAAEPGALTRGHSYRIELHASISTKSTASSTTGSADVHFDNVRLTIPDPPGNSSGVTFPHPPKSGPEIRALILSLNMKALAGDGPGGSLVPHDQCTILGTSDGDRIRGTSGNDVICGLGGNDGISGRGGRDVIDTGNGADRASGKSGGDLLLGLRGRDRLKGKNGNDRIGGGGAKDRLFGRGNADLLAAEDGRRDQVHGGAGGGDRALVDRGKGKGKAMDAVTGVERIRIR